MLREATARGFLCLLADVCGEGKGWWWPFPGAGGVQVSLTEEQKQLWDTGAALMTAGQFHEAQAAFDALAAALPSSAPAWVMKAFNLNRLQRYDEALTAIDYALALDASVGLAWCVKGDALLGLQRYMAATAAYGRALPLQTDQADALRGLVRGLIGSKLYDEALVIIDHLEQATPEDGHVGLFRAMAHNSLGQFSEALEALAKALRLGVGDVEYDALTEQAYAHFNLGHDEEALRVYEQAIHIRPSGWEGWEGKLKVLRRMGRWRALWQTLREFMAAKQRRQGSI
ncbi:MAG: tetratricopeptide repeat protein [Ktedonobacterales bacterium]